VGVSLTGLVSDIDYSSIVDQLIALERAPITRMRTEQITLKEQGNAFTLLQNALATLQTKAAALTTDLFDSRSAASSASSILTATATSGADLGSHTLEIIQLATAARQRGAADTGAALSATDDVSGLVLADAGFPTAITAGTLTVNNQTITIATSDTLQTVFDKINTATSGAVTGSYNHLTDTITLAGSSTIQLGSVADTSNFLNAARLYNNGTSTVTSASALGGIRLGSTLQDANFATALTGTGQFTINGVAINYAAATDTVSDIISRINASAAGVTARYDASEDRFNLTNDATGDVGVALQDVSGNFLAASGLLAGTLERGDNLLFTVDGGGQLVSQSNTINGNNAGLDNLTVTVHDTGTAVIQVAADTNTIREAITDFVEAYNSVQSTIDTQTASSTDSDGKVTAAALASESDVFDISRELRGLLFAGGLGRLGYETNGNDNSLALEESDALDNMLANSLDEVKELFTNASTGVVAKTDAYITRIAGDEGVIQTRQNTLTSQSEDIDRQVSVLEARLEDERVRMMSAFIAMEQFQARVNQQLDFLTRQLDQTSNSSNKK
jgi:flagellar hook-associated protein 2